MPFPDNLIAAIATLKMIWFVLAFVAILFDVVTGFVIKGLLAHNVQSSVMREGLIHKAWEVAIIMCAAMIDVALAVGMAISIQPVSKTTCIFIFVMELASVCENAIQGNPELASAPIIKYIFQARIEAAPDPDATAELPRHLGGE